ncbi:MAG TPA: GNAT family N-acetyltransferase [Thermoanaerobaculia bacterium]|nr:GNAT family N-acetyltransferase [Thermoanaerobaculia bacterium]
MPADARFVVRPYREGDEQAILDLFARSFPHAPRTLEHFRWKYRENPFGAGRISLTFDEEDRLVGHYCGYGVPFRGFGEDVLAHQIGDTMTDVSVRHVGRGPTSVLGRTALHFYEHFCEGQVAFNYGFNVANIQKFSLRFLRSDRVEPVTYRVRTEPFAPHGHADRWLRGYQLELVHDIDAEWDAFFDRVSRHYEFLVRRDARYVRWRYLQCPDVAYTLVAIRKWRHLVGWIAYRVRDGRFQWGDALFDPEFPDAVEVALRHLVPPLGVDAVEGWFPPRPQWFDAILRELGFETRPQPQDLSVMCVPFRWPDATARMRSALYYTWGDSDLF